MNKEFITYEQSLALKELGFDEPCLGYYYTIDNKIWHFAAEMEMSYIKDFNDVGNSFILSAPLYQQAFRWFRDKHGLYTEFFISDDKTLSYMITYFIDDDCRVDRPIRRGFTTYEDAEFDCLKMFTELVKQNQLLTDIMEADQKDGLYDENTQS